VAHGLISGLIWLNAIVALGLFVQPRQDQGRLVSQLTNGISIALLVAMWWLFDQDMAAMQLVEQRSWFSGLGTTIPLHTQYHLGVDGFSIGLVALTVTMHVLVIMATRTMVSSQQQWYVACMHFSEAMMVGLFCALDGWLWYLFWEGMLIPTVLCVGIWGGQQKAYAAVKLFLFTFTGSAMLLVAMVYMAVVSESMALSDWVAYPWQWAEQCGLAAAMMLAFAIKVPMWGVHTWLPDAHTQAPTGGSVILAAVMLKAGAYGMIRLVMPICPDVSAAIAPWVVGWSVLAMVVISFVALYQHDVKRLIAYSSIAHMGVVTAGLFVGYLLAPAQQHWWSLAMQGALVQMIAHGFGSGGLFMAFGMIYQRSGQREISRLSGLAKTMPVMAVCFMLLAMNNAALPLTAGFVGEFMVIMALVAAYWPMALLAALTMILAPAYTLWLYHRIFYQPAAVKATHNDVVVAERVVLAWFVAGIVVIGVMPNILLQPLQATTKQWIQQVTRQKG